MRRGRSIPSGCLSFFLGPRRRGPRPGPPPGRTRRRGCPELRAGAGAGRGAGGGPGGVTWRASAAEAEVTAPASEGVRGRECPQPGRRAAARGTPEPGPVAGARPGEWPGRVRAHAGARGTRARGAASRGDLCPGAAGAGRGGARRRGPRPLCPGPARRRRGSGLRRRPLPHSGPAPLRRLVSWVRPALNESLEEAARLAVWGSCERWWCRLRWPGGGRACLLTTSVPRAC